MGLYHIHDELPKFKNSVITIGTFDGVHEGHKTIIRSICKKAKEINGESVLITFDPHPKQIIRPDQPTFLISSPKEKYNEIFRIGVDHIVVIPFTRAFSLLSAEEYVHDILIKNFNPRVITIGYDHQFGHDRKGNIDTLRDMLSDQIEIIEIPEHLINDAHVSSTQVRQAILNGDMPKAKNMLGRPYKLEGIVVHGQKLGRQIGFPTANISIGHPHIIVPPTGIYAVNVFVKNHKHYGVISIGTRPTVSNTHNISYEVYILNFNEDIYGEVINVDFIQKIREELKFDNLDQLIDAIKKDVEDAKLLF